MIGKINNWSFGQYIIAGIAFVLLLFIAYILFFVMLWGLAVGVIAYILVSLKNRFITTKKRKPITIEHNSNQDY